MTIATWLTHFILFVTYFLIMLCVLFFTPIVIDKLKEWRYND